MSCDLDVTDCFGRSVRLDHSNWVKHQSRHPEAIPYHDQIAEVVADPDVVVEAGRDGHHHFYRRGLTRGRFRQHYLRVVVEYFGGGRQGKIKTWWLSSTVDTRGVLRWSRRQTR